MPDFQSQGASIFYEIHGEPANPPVMLIAGLGGTGASWATQVRHFAEKYMVVVPDHRGTGRSTRTLDGHVTSQLALDFAALIEHLDLGPIHVVGSSTGGAVAQYMALDHDATVRSVTLASTFARFDPFMKLEFEVRRKMAEGWDRKSLLSGFALFLMSPRYMHEHPDKVAEWIERAGSSPSQPQDKEIGLARIDMIAAHDAFDRLKDINKPTLVICGDHNFCTPLPCSEELARTVPGAEFVIIQDAGELIEIEKEREFFEVVSGFIDRNR